VRSASSLASFPNSAGLAGICAALETERESAYLLGPDLALRFVNEGWRRFALENGAPELASDWASLGPIGNHLTPSLRDYYQSRFERVLAFSHTWTHIYECSSPNAYRKFRMRAQAMAGGHGLVVIHSLVIETSWLERRAAVDDRMRLFTDVRGMIVACESCGRVRRADEPSIWDWAPGLLGAQSTNVSHGVCAPCEVELYGA